MNIGNEHGRCVAQPVGENVAAPAAEEERWAYERCLLSLRAIAGHYQCDLSEALVHVDVVKNVSAADFANYLSA